MVRVLLVSQDKGGVGKSLLTRALAEAVPDAPLLEIDSTRRLLELEARTSFFVMRATREEIDRTGGKASRAEFDAVITAVATASTPTIVDVGANTGRSLMTVLGDLSQDLASSGLELALLVVVTAEPGALAEAPRLLKLAKPWAAKRFVVENRLRGPVDPAVLKSLADGAGISVLDDHAMEDAAVALLQAGGLASIPKLDATKLNAAHGLALGARVRRDLTRFRADAIEAVRAPAQWLVGSA